MRNNKNRVVLIVIITLIVLILGMSGVGAYLYLKTDLFKSNQQLFGKYIGQTVNQIKDIIEIEKIEEIGNKINESSTETKAEMYLQADDIEGLEENKLTITTLDDKKNKKLYNNVKFLSGEESLVQVESMTTQNSVSLRLTDIVKQFLTIENRDLEKLSENLGIEETQLQQIFTLLQYQETSNLVEISGEELKTLGNTYLNIISNNLNKDNFTKQKDVMITIDSNTITTNAYTLTISGEQIKTILQAILEQLKNDEIILSKIEQINKLQQENSESIEKNALEEEYIETLVDALKEISKLEVEGEIKFIVYEQSGKTVRVKIEKDMYTVTMDLLVNDEILGVNTEFSVVENNNEANAEINLTKYKNENYDLAIEFKNSLREDESTVLEIKAIENENNINLEMVINIIIEGESIKAVVKSNIGLFEEITGMITFDKTNNIILNDLTPERCSQMLELIGNAVVEKYEEKVEAITELIMLYMASDSIGDTNLSEIEVEQFNARFQTYEGDNVTGAQVNALSRMIFNNNLGQNEDEKKVEIIGDVILTADAMTLPAAVADTEKTYMVEMQYDETTGLINTIKITEN